MTPQRGSVRAGGSGDGGYVVPDYLDGLDGVVSIGVGGDVSFDLWFAERGVPVFQYDHTVAESPVGHVSLRLVMQHALWDSWVHERDIMLPLGLAPVVESDEVRSCLQYAAALGAALSIGLGQPITGRFSVQAANPSVTFALEVTNLVAISELADGVVSVTASCLQGDAVQLAEALSIRVPLASSAPHEWHALLGGLATAFDTPSEAG